VLQEQAEVLQDSREVKSLKFGWKIELRCSTTWEVSPRLGIERFIDGKGRESDLQA
jgi:hypothetical protein